MLIKLLLVGAGGALGAVLRYLLASVALHAPDQSLPLGTLLVNLIGCLAIGAVIGLLDGREHLDGLRLALIVGVLGGFTTFSTFALETLELLRAGRGAVAAFYVLASNIGGVALAWLGYVGARTIA